MERYRVGIDLVDLGPEVLTGFNANIDVIHHGFKTESDPELFGEVNSMDELESSLSYCREKGENHEVDYSGIEVEGGEEYIGGQGGIVSNFLAKTGNSVIFYTPVLSGELSQMMDEKVLYPVQNGEEFVLKNIRDSANSERTKKNHIFEFSGDKTGRLILSDSLKGYGPYLPKYVEENIDLLQENIDCCFFSGFHNASGNREAKILKAKRQLQDIGKPVHLEYVHDPDTVELIEEHIIPAADSLGMDETEFTELCERNDIDLPEKPNFGESFAALKQLLETLEMKRIHLHTFRYHILVAREDYPSSLEHIRDSMLYGEVCAVQSAEIGGIPETEDITGFDMEGKHLQGLQQLSDFGEFHRIEDFESEGVAIIDGLKVVGVPVIIHEDPERTVGMGDIISSGAFSSEIKLSQDC